MGERRLIKPIKGGYEETLKRVTKTWMWTCYGYVDEEGNLKKNNKDFSKVMKVIAKPKCSEVNQ